MISFLILYVYIIFMYYIYTKNYFIYSINKDVIKHNNHCKYFDIMIKKKILCFYNNV